MGNSTSPPTPNSASVPGSGIAVPTVMVTSIDGSSTDEVSAITLESVGSGLLVVPEP